MELAATGAGTDLPGTVQDQTLVVPVVEQSFLGRVLLPAPLGSELQVEGRMLRAPSCMRYIGRTPVSAVVYDHVGLETMPNKFWQQCQKVIFGEAESKETPLRSAPPATPANRRLLLAAHLRADELASQWTRSSGCAASAGALPRAYPRTALPAADGLRLRAADGLRLLAADGLRRRQTNEACQTQQEAHCSSSEIPHSPSLKPAAPAKVGPAPRDFPGVLTPRCLAKSTSSISES